MTQGEWWSWYAYEDDDAHVMHVKECNHNTGLLQASAEHAGVPPVAPPSRHLNGPNMARGGWIAYLKILQNSLEQVVSK